MKTNKFISGCFVKISFTALLFFISFVAMAQEGKHKNVEIVNDTTTIKFQVIESKTKMAPQANTVYTWYFNNKIYTTKGEYSGLLLDGDYKEYDKKGKLKMEGKYTQGGKTGEWKKWSVKGEVTTMDASVKDEQNLQNIVAETRDTVNHHSNAGSAATAKAEKISDKKAASDTEEKPIKMSWNQKKRHMINKWKFDQEQKRTAKESGSQIRKKNRKEEKYIASPVGVN
jgi:antitoxin component YwqK of YwqJK toxin-antitoxin module